MALVVVLVVITLVSLAAYSFTESMILENEAAEFAGRAAQARAWAQSGVEYAAQLAQQRNEDEEPINVYHDVQRFAAVAVQPGLTTTQQGRFSLIAPVEADATFKTLRYGMIDESGKLNLNTVSSWKLDPEQAQALLLAIPGMTASTADSILDWIDADDTPLANGAESETYAQRDPPYAAKNGKLDSLEELLLVEGVSADLLYGEDVNRNGLLDPNEDDGAASAPSDNQDGVLDLGWSAYLTVSSRETNLQNDGTPRLNVNEGILADLYDKIASEFGSETAQFVAAVRMSGPLAATPSSTAVASAESGGSRTGGGGAGGGATGGGGNASGGGGGAELVNALFGTPTGSVTRDGMDLTAGGPVQISSLYQLVDASASATMSGAKKTLVSPWTSKDPQGLLTLFKKFSITNTRTIEGRINVNQARREVLLGLPDMTPELATSIVSAQQAAISNGLPAERQITAWLLTNGATDLATLTKLDKYLTGRGDVYRVQALGHTDRGGPVVRIEAVIDASTLPAQVVQHRDLTDLGQGYPLPTVGTATTTR